MQIVPIVIMNCLIGHWIDVQLVVHFLLASSTNSLSVLSVQSSIVQVHETVRVNQHNIWADACPEPQMETNRVRAIVLYAVTI